MPASCTYVYVHFVWAVWDRFALITPALEDPIYACIAQECRKMKCDVIAIGGVGDHVHVLVQLHATVSIAALAKQMKGASSHLVTHVLDPDQAFKWQETYGAFSVSATELDRICAYVRNQKQHHASADIWPEWEQCMEIDDHTTAL